MARNPDAEAAIAEAREAWLRVRSRQETRDASSRTKAPAVSGRVMGVFSASLCVAAMPCVVAMFAPIGPAATIPATAVSLLLVCVGTVLTLRVAAAPERSAVATRARRDVNGSLDAWLADARPRLPPSTASMMGTIRSRVSELSAMTLPDSLEEGDLRTLVLEQMPALVRDFERVPSALRDAAGDGPTPVQILERGLSTIETELSHLSSRLASTRIDDLRTRGRYLDMRYGTGG